MRLLQSGSAAVAVALVLAAATATHPLSPEPRIKRRFDEKPPLRPRVKGGYSAQPIHAHPQPAAAAPQVVGLSAPALGEAGPGRRVAPRRRRAPLALLAAAAPLVALPAAASALGAVGLPGDALGVPLPRDLAVSALAAAGAVGWLRAVTFLASNDLVETKLSRKIIHCGSAPLFVLAWRFYSSDPTARLAAALVPLLNVAKIVGAAQRAVDARDRGLDGGEKTFVDAVSRTGDPREVLGGPLIYTLVLFAATLFGFRSPAAVVALCQMAVGDGLADIAGRRFGDAKWFCNGGKSYAGSLAFFAGATAASLGLLAWLGLATVDVDLAARVAAVSAACALVEVVPAPAIGIDDNVSVPLVGALLALLLLPA